MKNGFSFALLALSVFLFCGCGKKAQETFEPTEEVTTQTTVTETTTEVTEEMPPAGMDINPLTGLYIKEEAIKRRPVAVMINNAKKALPQSGISQADIIYETFAEGDVTRLLAIFSDFDAEKIGPIRSARHYYLDFAFDNDALYVHHGGSPDGYSQIRKLNVNNLDGMALDGKTFFRDKERVKIKSMYEHSSYSSFEGIMKSWGDYKYRQDRDYFPGLSFYEEDKDLQGGSPALDVYIPFSGSQRSEFIYDETEKLYKRYQSDNPHIDEMTGETLTAKNIIIWLTSIYEIKGDKEGRRNVETVGSGKGYFITNGQAVPITWTKAGHKEPVKWFDESGKPLILNRGKTWIEVYNNESRIDFNKGIEQSTEAGSETTSS